MSEHDQKVAVAVMQVPRADVDDVERVIRSATNGDPLPDVPERVLRQALRLIEVSGVDTSKPNERM